MKRHGPMPVPQPLLADRIAGGRALTHNEARRQLVFMISEGSARGSRGGLQGGVAALRDRLRAQALRPAEGPAILPEQILAQQRLRGAAGRDATERRLAAGARADRLHLGHIFRHGKQIGHGTKRLALEIHIKSGNYYPHTTIGQFYANLRQFIIKKLCLINTNHLYIVCQ